MSEDLKKEAMFRSGILAIEGYQSGEQPQGGKFIKLNTNENPYRCSEKVVTAIKSVADAGLETYPDATASAFRTVAGELFDIDANMILCGNGSDEILTIVTRAFVGEGQTVRWPYPTYVLYPVLTAIQGAAFDPVNFASDWKLSESFFINKDNLRLVFLANPNSPSGTLVAKDDIVRLAEELPCPILIDEAYADFAGTSCIDLVRQNEKILVSRTLSKSYGLAGLRFGYLVGQPHIIKQLNKVRDSYNCDALSIAGATAAVSDAEWLKENIAKIVATRQSLFKQLKRLGFEVTESHANFLWCEHPEKTNLEIYEELKRHQILIRYMDFPGWGNGLRITVGTDEQVDALVMVLEQILLNTN